MSQYVDIKILFSTSLVLSEMCSVNKLSVSMYCMKFLLFDCCTTKKHRTLAACMKTLLFPQNIPNIDTLHYCVSTGNNKYYLLAAEDHEKRLCMPVDDAFPIQSHHLYQLSPGHTLKLWTHIKLIAKVLIIEPDKCLHNSLKRHV